MANNINENILQEFIQNNDEVYINLWVGSYISVITFNL